MTLERIDLSALEPYITKMVTAAQEPNSRLTAAALRETGLALLARARTQPALAFPQTILQPSTWVGTYLEDGGDTAVSIWSERSDVLFQAEWEGKALRSLLVQIADRMWMSDSAHPQGWQYDPPRALELIDDAQNMTETKNRVQEIALEWDQQHHPKSGWRCSYCGWQNPAADATCALCHTQAQPMGADFHRGSREGVPATPPLFDQPLPPNTNPGQVVDLTLPDQVEALLHPAADSPTEKTNRALLERLRDALSDPGFDTADDSHCWRCKTELKKDLRVCPRCGADQQIQKPPPSRPTYLPE